MGWCTSPLAAGSWRIPIRSPSTRKRSSKRGRCSLRWESMSGWCCKDRMARGGDATARQLKCGATRSFEIPACPTRWLSSPPSGQNRGNDFARDIRQAELPALELERQAFVVDAEELEKRRLEIVYIHAVFRD